jgi:hypothetical protein
MTRVTERTFAINQVLRNIVLPRLHEVLWADDQCLCEVIVLEDLCKRSRHKRLSETHDVTDEHASTLGRLA